MKSRTCRLHRGPRTNPVAAAMLRATIRRDINALRTAAELQAWTGGHAANLLNSSGRLLYIVLMAAGEIGLTHEDPDIRILLGMGEALGDLATDGRLEFHRPAIQAGLLAIERVLPELNDWDMGKAALSLDQKVSSADGMGTADLRAAVGLADT